MPARRRAADAPAEAATVARWHGAAGASLTCSLAWPFARADLSGLSLAVGVALADALEPPPGAGRIGLKWPNDLWLLDGARGATGRRAASSPAC